MKPMKLRHNKYGGSMKKRVFLATLGLFALAGCKGPVESSHSSNTTHSSTTNTVESSDSITESSTGSLEGLYHTAEVDGSIKFTNQKGDTGVYFYCTEGVYGGYHSLENVKVYHNGEILDNSKLEENMDAVGEFITGFGKEDGHLDLSIGDLYKVTIVSK